jgi:predicted TIM-barrel fold metal-dependent hydrolase
MEIVDAQVHTWLSDRPRRPWVPSYRERHRDKLPYLQHAGQTNSTEMAVLEMAEVGVDAALLTPNGVYGTDNGYEFEGAGKYPGKFRVVGWIDHLADDVEERLAADVARGMVGVRIPELRDRERHERGEFTRVLDACQAQGLVVALMVFHPLPELLVGTLERYAGIPFVIGHLGVGIAPPVLGVLPEDPFENLPAVLDLARLDNVHMNLTGAPSLSRERFPFRDVWDGVHRIVDAFGPDRVMWGSDYTRTAGLHSYWDGTHYLREVPGLGPDELAKIYGSTLRRVYDWPAG